MFITVFSFGYDWFMVNFETFICLQKQKLQLASIQKTEVKAVFLTHYFILMASLILKIFYTTIFFYVMYQL